MLVLKRNVGERVVIDGGRVVVCVNRIESGAVSLAFEAEPTIRIDRQEIHQIREDRRHGKQS